jgi:tetratricopeptide (TPR) repeat protein
MTLNRKVCQFIFLSLPILFYASCSIKEVAVSPILSIPDYIKTVTNPAIGYEKELDAVFLKSFNGAWTKLQSGKADEAEVIFEDIIDSKPGFYPAYVGIGYLKMMDESYNNAMRNFNMALKIKKDYLHGMLGLGALYRVMGDNLKAYNVYGLVLEKFPRQPEARMQYDIIRLKETDRYLLLARSYKNDGKFDPAWDNYKKALNYVQEEDFIFHEVGDFLTANKRYKDALTYLQRANELRPNNPDYLKSLASVLEKSGKPADARAYYKKALDLRPTDAVLRADIERVTRAAQRIKTGENGREIQTMEKLTRAAAAVYLEKNFPFPGEPDDSKNEIITDIIDNPDNLEIISMVKRGIFDTYSDHTFAPNQPLTRLDLAMLLDRLIKHSTETGAQMKFNTKGVQIDISDIPINTPSYPIIRRIVTLGLMSLQADKKFNANQNITGRDFVLAVDRLSNLLESED